MAEGEETRTGFLPDRLEDRCSAVELGHVHPNVALLVLSEATPFLVREAAHLRPVLTLGQA